MKTHTSSRRASALLSVGALTLAGLALSSSAALAVGTPSYDSRITLESTPSLAFYETNTAEFGDYIRLAGTDRNLENITVGLNGWACEFGTYYEGTCLTTPGTGFNHPVTVTVYAKSGDDPEVNGSLPGAVLATVTQTIFVPYRPSPDPKNCGKGTTMWYSVADDTCYDGHAFLATFDFSALGVVLPTDVIVSIAYETTATSANPAGPITDADLLNVGVAMLPPTVGTDVSPADMYLNSTEASTYADGGAAGMGVFRADLGAWARNPGLILLINTSTPAKPDTSTPEPELAETGLDSAGSAVGLIALGGLALGSAAVVASAVRRRSRA